MLQCHTALHKDHLRDNTVVTLLKAKATAVPKVRHNKEATVRRREDLHRTLVVLSKADGDLLKGLLRDNMADRLLKTRAGLAVPLREAFLPNSNITNTGLLPRSPPPAIFLAQPLRGTLPEMQTLCAMP